MPRGAPSRADSELLAALAGEGHAVSAYQLERWRLAGLLPRPARQALGRGAGSASAYPAEAADCARLLAVTAGQGRSLHLAALSLYVAALPVDSASVRAAMCWALERRQRLLEQAAERYGDALHVAERAARQVGIYEPDVVASYFPDLLEAGGGPSRADLRRRAERRQDIRRAYITATAAAIDPKEVPDEDQIDFMATVGMHTEAADLRAEMYRAARAGELFGTADPAFPEPPSLAEVGRTATAEQLNETRDVVRACGAVNFLLYLSASLDRRSWELYSSLYTDPRWVLARGFGATTPLHPTGIVLSALTQISCDNMSDSPDGLFTLACARGYAYRYLPEALRAFVRSTRAINAEFGPTTPEGETSFAEIEELADDLADVPAASDANAFLTRIAVALADAWFEHIGASVKR